MATGSTYRHYILKDHLGSRTTITDAEGNVEQEHSCCLLLNACWQDQQNQRSS